jgi:hypothetical protein
MTYGNNARLALTTHTFLHANGLVSPIGDVTPLGFRQCSGSETPFHVGLFKTAVQLTFTSLIDPAEPEFLGTVPWLPDRTIVTYVFVFRLRAIPTTQALCRQQRSRCASHAPLVPQSLPSTLCPWGKASVAPLQSTLRRCHDGSRARGVHRR